MTLIARTAPIQHFLDATAAKQPTPGGGSVTALAGALAAAIGEMVVSYSVGKKDLAIHRPALEAAAAELHRARAVLLELMEEDQFGYATLTDARKLPDTAADRLAKIDAALNACIAGPESMAAAGVAILSVCERIVPIVNHHLLSDLAVCAELAMALTRCGIYNVRVNLAELRDAARHERVNCDLTTLLENARHTICRVIPAIWELVDQDT